MITGEDKGMVNLEDNTNADLVIALTHTIVLVTIEEVLFLLKIDHYGRDENRESRKYHRNSPTYERDGR